MRRQQGFSMLEVLITMVVVSVGLLGIAGLIMTNLKNNHSAYSRGQATILANDIIDRMRANRSVAQPGGKYVIDFGTDATSVASVAERDLVAWRSAVKDLLKDGNSSISFKDGGNVIVTIQWNDSRGTGDGINVGRTTQTYVQETRL